MRASGESTSHTSAAGGSSPAAVNSPHGESPRATDTSAAAGTANRNPDEPKIELIYSGELDDVADSKAIPHASGLPEPDTARARLTGSGERGGIMLEHLRTERFFGRILASRNAHADTNQEARDPNVLRYIPQVESPWIPSTKELDRTETIRAEEEFDTDVFFKHWWYNGSRARDGKALVQGWNALINNIECIGLEAWLAELDAGRIRFEKRNAVGARYKLHRLSREAGLPCISWGDSCPGCLENSYRAPRKAFLPNDPYWKARISSEMAEGIDTLQSLYSRSGNSFFDGPSSNAAGGSRHIARRDPERQQSAGREAPNYPKPVDSHASFRGNSSGALHVAVVQDMHH
uniref:Uncharacterized protein n=1 Tax=Peronospora matthiolae TaxID=2874970 RepID=A0AAV1VGJ4_9STRA